MGNFDLDIDLYFWMIDRGEMEDDQRNRVEIEQQRVNLHREHAQRLENAIYIAKVMQVIRKTIIKKSKSPFALDPQLNHLKDQGTTSARQYNWEVVAPELRKFGIKINKDKKQQLVSGKQSAIQEVVQQLYDYDQAILTYPTVVGLKNTSNSPGRSPKQGGNNNSELNFGLAQNSLERVDVQVGSSPNKKRYKDSEKNSDIGKPISLINLDSEELFVKHPKFREKTSSPNLAQLNGTVDPSKTYDGLQEAIGYDILDSEQLEYKEDSKNDYLEKVQSIHQQVGRNSIRNKTQKAPTSRHALQGENESTSILEFILDSLGQSLGMNSTQTAALLSSNHKFLVHLCINGMKGQDYSKLYNWYVFLLKSKEKFVNLLENEANDAQAFGSALSVVKCGLFSLNVDIANLCARSLTSFCSVALQREAEGGGTYGVTQMIWDWYVNSQNISDPNVPSKIDTKGVPPSPTKQNRDRQQKKQKELEAFINESGLKSFLRAYRRHQLEFTLSLQDSLIAFGSDNYVDLFTLQLQQNAFDNVEFFKINRDIFNSIVQSQYFDLVMINSGVLNILIEMSVSMNDQRNSNNVSSTEKLVSLTYLVDVWMGKNMAVQANADSIIQALKRGCRDVRSSAVRTTSITLMFHILDQFAQGRNKYAPVIYKALTFIVIDAYIDLPTREQMIKNFILLFINHQHIPVAILSEPLLKQVKIYLERQELINQQQPQNVLQPVQDTFSFNVIDFELFLAIAQHQKLDINTAQQLLSIGCDISRKNILFTRVSLKLILQILARYENNDKIQRQCIGIVSDLLILIQTQDLKKIQIYNQLKNSPGARKAIRKGEESLTLPSSPQKTTRRNSNPRIQSPNKKQQKLDDIMILNILDPQKTAVQMQEFMNMKTSEKLIVNLIQCIMSCGQKEIFENIKTQILDMYVHIERQIKFNNKGLLYLLQLFDKEIGKTLQISRQKQVKIQKQEEEEKIRQFNQKKIISKQTFQLQQNKKISDSSKNDTQQINHIRMQSTTNSEEDEQRINPEIFRLKGSQNDSAIDDINDRDQNISYLPSIRANKKIVDTIHLKNKSSFGSRAKSNPNIGYKGAQQRLRRNQSNESLREISGGLSGRNVQFYYDINEQSDQERKWYQKFLKKKQRLYKALFHKYAGASGDTRTVKQTFDSLKQSANTMNLKAVHTFIQDFKITKLEFAKRDDIKKLIALINIKQQLNTRTISDLDEVGYIEFILQMGYLMFNQPNENYMMPPSQFMPQLFERLKEASLASPQPLFQGLFDPESVKLHKPQTEAEIIQLLTNRINEDNNYELPEGYKVYEIEQEGQNQQNESEWIVSSIINDLLESKLGIEMDIKEFDNQVYYPQFQVYKEQYLTHRKQSYQGQNKTPNQYQKIAQKRFTRNQVDTSQSLDSVNTEAITALGVGNGAKARRIKPLVTTDDSSNNYSGQGFILGKQVSPQSKLNNGYLREQVNQPGQRFRQHKKAVSLARDIDYRGQSSHQISTIDHGDSSPFFEDEYGGNNGYQQRQYSPRVGYGGPVLNKIQLAKMNEKQKQLDITRDRDEKLLKRQITLKKQLQGFQQKKKDKNADDLLKQREKKQNSILVQTKQETIKKEMYEQIKFEYDLQRLPELQKNQQQQRQLRQQEKTQKKKKREAALKAQEVYTQKIKEDLLYKIQLKKEDEEIKRQQDEHKKRLDQNRRNKYDYVEHDPFAVKKLSNASNSPKKHNYLQRKPADQRSLSVLHSRNKKGQNLKTDLTQRSPRKQLSPRIQSGRRRSALSNRSQRALSNQQPSVKLPPVQVAPQPFVQEVKNQEPGSPKKKGFFGKLF